MVELGTSLGEFIGLVPRDVDENLRFRIDLLQQAQESEEVRRDLWVMCSRDILFWFNAFLWTYDARLKLSKRVPFITYPFQDRGIVDLLDSIEQSENRAINKTRDMGLSWMCCATIFHQWLFSELFSALLVSRKEEYVVCPGDDKALFTKMDFIWNNLPAWMLPVADRFAGRWVNYDNGATLGGEATTGDVGRGSRKTVILFDEFGHFPFTDAYQADASTANSTDCRWFNSTPRGSGGCFFDKCHPKEDDIFAPKYRFYHWREHPEHRRGMYQWVDGEVKILDHRYDFPADYPYRKDGHIRSPWYDKKEAELGYKKNLVAQELEGDFLGSGHPFFDAQKLQRVIKLYAGPPFKTGILTLNSVTGEPKEFVEKPEGLLKLWIHPDAFGEMPTDRDFVVGVDVSTGTGASNSAASVYDRQTKEKVAECQDARQGPYEWAEFCVALCKLFCGRKRRGARLIWEANGAGRTFGKRVLELGYGNIFYRDKAEDKVVSEASDFPGWWSTPNGKRDLLTEYSQALNNGEIINRSRTAIEECENYRFKNGQIVHFKSLDTDNESGARENHGDIVIADALSWREMRADPKPVIDGEVPRSKRQIPPNCVAARREARMRNVREGSNPFVFGDTNSFQEDRVLSEAGF